MKSKSIEFFYKDDCHLCETLEGQLMEYLKKYKLVDKLEVIKCDIEEKEAWYQRYREYVPVLVFADTEICHYFFDENEMNAALDIPVRKLSSIK